MSVERRREIRVIAHQWIPLSDGSRLAARIWLPKDAEKIPVPAVLEYIPYRKNDFMVLDDTRIHPYFAEHGYAALRVDMRGSGDSDGVLEDEYLPLEQDDAIDILAWLEAQPWCTGKVGIIGKSWGGFNGLQIAARRPPQLAAVISVCSTDDRYADDVHYMGGCVLASDMLSWASNMLVWNARPPDPKIVGDSWREKWLDRLERTPPYIDRWLTHQRRDAYWKQGSICESYADVQCPVYMVGGWGDAYRDSILRVMENHPGPVKGLIGPWAHTWPHDGAPGPAIGFLQECVRWWDRWLKDINNGIMDEPRLRTWMQEAVRPAPSYSVRPGYWLADTGWPTPNVQSQEWYCIDSGELRTTPHGADTMLPVHGLQANPGEPGAWCGGGGAVDCPTDQRVEDGVSLTFDTPPLTEAVEILGVPRARFTLTADQAQALVAVRLCDVWPDGASTLITRGMLNLTHRKDHEHPQPLRPGEQYSVEIPLTSVAYAVPAGHRLRVAISPTYWPWAWPAPHPVRLEIRTNSSSRLDLPVRTSVGETPPLFPEAEAGQAPPHELLHEHTERREVRRDTGTGAVEVTYTHFPGNAIRFLDDGLEYRDYGEDRFRIVEGDPLSASVTCRRVVDITREGWQTRVETVSTMTADENVYRVTNDVDAYEAGVRIFANHRTATIPRDHT